MSDTRKASETIYSSVGFVIPMADVSHIERHYYSSDKVKTRETARGCLVITDKTKWNFEHDCWENAIYLPKDGMDKFLKAWCYFRSEIDDCMDGPK